MLDPARLDAQAEASAAHAAAEAMSENLLLSGEVRALETAQVGGYVRVDFVITASESGDKYACNMSLFVKLGAAGIKWAK